MRTVSVLPSGRRTGKGRVPYVRGGGRGGEGGDRGSGGGAASAGPASKAPDARPRRQVRVVRGVHARQRYGLGPSPGFAW